MTVLYLASEFIAVQCQASNFLTTSQREQVTSGWDYKDVCFVLDQHAKLDFLYSVISLKHITLCKTVKKKNSKWFWQVEAHECERDKYASVC